MTPILYELNLKLHKTHIQKKMHMYLIAKRNLSDYYHVLILKSYKLIHFLCLRLQFWVNHEGKIN